MEIKIDDMKIDGTLIDLERIIEKFQNIDDELFISFDEIRRDVVKFEQI